MGFFDRIKEGIDETKDKVEESTGIDIDRDGDTGSEPDNEPSQDVDPVEESADNIVSRNTGSVEENDSGSDSDSGGGGGSSFDPVEESVDNIVDRNTGGDDNDSSSSSSSSSSSGSSSSSQEINPVQRSAEKIKARNQQPEELDLEETRTLQQDQTYSNTGRKVQGFLDQREKELEAKQEIRSQRQKITSADKDAQFKTNGETVTKDEALQQLNQIEKSVEQQQQETVNQFNDFREFNNERNNQDDLKTEIRQAGRDIQRLGGDVRQGLGGGETELRGSFEDASRSVRDVGLELMDTGEDVGQEFQRRSPKPNAEIIGAYGDFTGNALAQDLEKPVREAEKSFQSGLGTFGTQAAGFFTAGAGSFGVLAEEGTRNPGDTAQDLAQGVGEFGGATLSQFRDDRDDFVLQELGEEVGETAIGFAVLGPAGAALGASPTPTPNPNVQPDINPSLSGTLRGEATIGGGTRVGPGNQENTPDFVNDFQVQTVQPETNSPSALDRIVAQAVPGNNMLIADTDTRSTPDFVNDFQVQTVQPETVTQPDPLQGFDTAPEIEPETETVTGTTNRGSILAQPSIEQSEILDDAVAAPQAVNEAAPEAVPQIESFIESRAQTFSETTPVIESTTQRFEPILETRVEPTPEPRPDTLSTPDAGFEGGADNFLDDFEPEPREQLPDSEGEFAPSLTAGLFNIQAEEDFEEEEFVGTGTEIRPLTEDFL